MRKVLVLAGTALLGACGGGGGGSVNSIPLIAGTPTSSATNPHTFVNPAEPKTYVGIGGSLVHEYTTDDRDCCDQQAITYAGNATTVRNSTIQIGYDPRSSLYTLKIADTASGADTNTSFQDPANRTDFGGTVEPQWGTPNLNNPNIQYLQAGDGGLRSPYSRSGSGFVNSGTNSMAPEGNSPSSYQATSLFVLKPGSETKYVTYAGYARNALNWADVQAGNVTAKQYRWHLERGAFAFGELTANTDVPKTGTGTYTGSMLASVVFNPTLDGQDQSGATVLPTFFQWMTGTSRVNVDFTNSSFTTNLTGSIIGNPQFDYHTSPQSAVLQTGATFTAAGSGAINMVNFGGFKGQFSSAAFQNPGGGANYAIVIAGSSIDGTFYGPNGEEVGGGFRIVGGKPDERIDILGAFSGKK